jgi:hypothetical protein
MKPVSLPACYRCLLCALVAGLLLGVPGASSSDLTRDAEQCADQLGRWPVAEGEALSLPLEIISWNIQKNSQPGWASELLSFGGETHLTFIQEATLKARLGELRPSGPLYQSFAEGYITASRRTGVILLGTRKAATVTEHVLEGHRERLLAINLHAVNFTFNLQELQAQLQPLVVLLSSHRGPAILAGDINTWSDARQRLVDGLLAQCGLSPLHFDPDWRTRFFGRPLDHIYVRGLVAEHTEVIPVRSSDHNALRARLQLSP